MKFIYKGTGTIVESDHVLDSAIFEPVEEIKPAKKADKPGRKKKTEKE